MTENWLLMAFVAPLLWALVVLLDVYFVHQVYTKAHEGSVIAGLFQGSVFPLIPFIGFNWPGNIAGALFVVGGILFILYIHWYFKSMVLNGDGVFVQILSNLAIVFVPVLAWVFVGEKLNLTSYAGIGLVFVGGITLVWGDSEIREKNLTVVIKTMIPAVFLLSLSMVLQKRGYEIVGDDGFWSGFFLFSFGVVIGGMLIFLFHNERKNLFERINNISRKYFFIFVFTESLHVAGTWTAQKAISLAPSVSLVAAIESLIPLFVMLGGLVIVFFYRKHAIEVAYTKQIEGMKGKSVAIILIAAGIYLAVRG